MEVLLRSDIENLGQMGDVVEVANGYARNYLLPRKLAVEVSPVNLKMVDAAREAKHRRELDELERLGELGDKLAGFLCYLEMRATGTGHLFGSVGPEQVAQSLVESGFDTIRPSNVNMPTHIEELGDFDVEIMLHPEVRANILLRVAQLSEEEAEE